MKRIIALCVLICFVFGIAQASDYDETLKTNTKNTLRRMAEGNETYVKVVRKSNGSEILASRSVRLPGYPKKGTALVFITNAAPPYGHSFIPGVLYLLELKFDERKAVPKFAKYAKRDLASGRIVPTDGQWGEPEELPEEMGFPFTGKESRTSGKTSDFADMRKSASFADVLGILKDSDVKDFRRIMLNDLEDVLGLYVFPFPEVGFGKSTALLVRKLKSEKHPTYHFVGMDCESKKLAQISEYSSYEFPEDSEKLVADLKFAVSEGLDVENSTDSILWSYAMLLHCPI